MVITFFKVFAVTKVVLFQFHMGYVNEKNHK